MTQAINKFWENVGKSKMYMGWTVFCVFSAYFFSLANRTISIDGLSADRYYYNPNAEGGVLAGKRWGFYVFKYLFSAATGVTSTDRIMAVTFMTIAAFLLCVILYTVSSREISKYVYAGISAMFVTFPLINEVSEYAGTYAYIGMEFCIIMIVILCHVTLHKIGIKQIVIDALLLTLVSAGYESGVFAYITLVLLVMTVKVLSCDTKYSVKEYFMTGTIFAIPLAISVVIKYAVGYLFIALLDGADGSIGATQVDWSNGLEGLWLVLKANFYNYFIRGLIYFPIAVFAITTIVTFALLNFNGRNRIFSLVSYLLALISAFGLSYVQCTPMPYRTAQTIWVLVTVSIFIMAYVIDGIGGKRVVIGAFSVILLFVTLRQSIYLNELLSWNNLLSDNEAYIAREIGRKIVSECDSTKPVIIVGTYYGGKWVNVDNGNKYEDGWIESAIKKDKTDSLLEVCNQYRKAAGLEIDDYGKPDTNVNSYLSWAVRAQTIEDMDALDWYFLYWGYDINVLKDMTSEELAAYSELPYIYEMKRFEVKEFDQVILVFLG